MERTAAYPSSAMGWERTSPPPHPFASAYATPPARSATLRSSNESLASTSRRGPPPFSPPRTQPPQTPSSARPPSSRRALTAALELAQEAVRIDSAGEEPLAAIAAYGKSVALLSEVMERVVRGEGTERRRAGARRRSDAAREDEVRRLKSIHDTYADRMQILSLIYNMDTANQGSPSPDAPQASPDFQSAGFYPSYEDDDYDKPATTTTETIGSAFVTLDGASSLDYSVREHFSRDYHSSVSPSPSPSPHPEDYDHATPTEYQPTPISPTTTITPQRSSVLPPARPPPTGPPPMLPVPQPTYTIPQPPLPQPPLGQPPSHRVNGALPGPARVTRSQSASAGSRPDPHSPLRRSYVVPSQAQPPAQPQQPQPGRVRSGSVAGHKRSGSGNERLVPVTEEREREKDREASSGTESESWTVVGADSYIHHQPVSEGYRSTSEAYRSRVMSLGRDTSASIAREAHVLRELPPLPAETSSPLTPRLPISNVDAHPRSSAGVDMVQRPRGGTGSSTSSRGSDGPSSAGTVSTVPTNFSVSIDQSGMTIPGPNSLAMDSRMLVSQTTSQGSIAQRRKSAQPSIGQAMGFPPLHQPAHLPTQPQAHVQPPTVSLPPPPTVPTTARLTADTLPAGTATRLGIAPGRLRASSQPGRRPDAPSSAALIAARKVSASHSRMMFVRGIPSPVPWGVALSAAGVSIGAASQGNGSPSLVVHVVAPSLPVSSPMAVEPSSPQRRPFHLMGCLLVSLTHRSGGYLTKRLHVPHEVWSQGGAKLSNIPDKIRVLESLNSSLTTLKQVSDSFLTGRCRGEEWLKKLDDWTKNCEFLADEHGKKLGVGEGVIGKRGGGMTGKLLRGFDRITSGKNVDSPSTYAEMLRKVFAGAEMFDDHIQAIHSTSHPMYAPISGHVRKQIESRLAYASDFFGTVVLTFVVRDLGLLMDKFVKKTERWLEE